VAGIGLIFPHDFFGIFGLSLINFKTLIKFNQIYRNLIESENCEGAITANEIC
jgi:hypothetical protein